VYKRQLLGCLGYDRLRGKAVYSYEFDNSWLKNSTGVILSGDLQNYYGIQSKSGDIFNFLSDIIPDRWGKKLIDKREKIRAQNEGRVPETFSEMDYLLQLDDFQRIGALRIKKFGADVFIGTETYKPVPLLADLRQFIELAHDFERSENSGIEPDEDWLQNLFKQGSSLGGARPKANIRDEKCVLHIAKIPSINDTYDVALWEHLAHILAKNAGIKVADTCLLKLDGVKYNTLLSKRFDRTTDGRRIQIASSMTLAGLKDGDDASNDNGYLNIVDVIISGIGVKNVEDNLKELYRRVAFNIAIGNTDDHFRNHSFILGKSGWELSPAYDINPSNNMEQCLLINSNTNESSLDILLDSCNEYFINRFRWVYW